VTITSGFGLTLDLERGTLRHWTMRDGVRRWVVDGTLVQAPVGKRDVEAVEEAQECHTKK
jgi:hypothetical protein